MPNFQQYCYGKIVRYSETDAKIEHYCQIQKIIPKTAKLLNYFL